MDDFREWLSDNLRYILLGAAILIILLVLFFGVRACVGRKGNSDRKAGQQAENSQGNVPSSPTMDGETDDEKKDDASALELDAYPEVNALIKHYYQALGEKDVTTLRTLVDDLAPADESKITSAKDYIEGYQVNQVYTKKGLQDGDYVVYACYNFICKGISTPVPVLSQLYIRPDSSGQLKILGNQVSDPEISAYCDKLQNQEDVQQLISKVKGELEAAKAADSELQAFLEGLGEEADTSSQEKVGVQYAAVDNCYVRASADAEGEIIGSLYTGEQVERTGQEGDWIQISYNGATGYVFGELLQEVDTSGQQEISAESEILE